MRPAGLRQNCFLWNWQTCKHAISSTGCSLQLRSCLTLQVESAPLPFGIHAQSVLAFGLGQQLTTQADTAYFNITAVQEQPLSTTAGVGNVTVTVIVQHDTAKSLWQVRTRNTAALGLSGLGSAPAQRHLAGSSRETWHFTALTGFNENAELLLESCFLPACAPLPSADSMNQHRESVACRS